MDNSQLIEQERQRAERACKEAFENTPEPYRKYLVFISNNKNLGDRNNPIYVTVSNPYMLVDGRIQWALDDHRANEATLDIQTEFKQEGDAVLCKATAVSSMLGTRTAHARAIIGGGGADAKTPHENSETSSIGRVLGYFGYGLYGTGVDSVEEIQAVMVQESRSQSGGGRPSGSGSGSGPSERQKAFIRSLLKDNTNADDAAIERRIAQVKTREEASALIERIKAGDKNTPKPEPSDPPSDYQPEFSDQDYEF